MAAAACQKIAVEFRDEEAGPWMEVYLIFLFFHSSLNLIALFHQRSIIADEEACKKRFESNETDELTRKLFIWEDVEKSHRYQTTYYAFLMAKAVFCTFVFDVSIMYFKVPVALWNFYTGFFAQECDNKGYPVPDFNAQLLVGVACVITYKVLEIAFYTPWSAYLVFWLQKPNGLSKANSVSFLISRLIVLIQFAMLPLPLFLIVVKVTEWSGDNLVLVFFLATSSVEFVFVYLYPILIRPMTAKMHPLEEGVLKNEIMKLTKEHDIDPKIWVEEKHSKDLHSNASCMWGNITIGKSLIEAHKNHIDEVVAVVAHETGHQKMHHLAQGLVVDTIYMVIFGSVLKYGFLNKPGFLLAFGFTAPSYFASTGLFVWLFMVSIDIVLRLPMRAAMRENELQADRFSVQAGFGISAKNALIRNYKSNLSILYKSELDNKIYFSHPTLQARLNAMTEELQKNPTFLEKAQENYESLQQVAVEKSDEENDQEKQKQNRL